MADNGHGIEDATVDRGKEGHFGLQGMRERAARIGSKLTIGRSAPSGTENKLVAPGSSIYRGTRAPAKKCYRSPNGCFGGKQRRPSPSHVRAAVPQMAKRIAARWPNVRLT